MKILLLGGTGAIGCNLSRILAERYYSVAVTTRQKHLSGGNITYIQGNAKDNDFITKILKDCEWDAIVDFMVYGTEEFANRVDLLLQSCKQYIFLSSSRVYADSAIINEDSPRLLDVCTDKEFLATDEYSLKKARQEDILNNNKLQNWTIIRPYITYDTYRLQLGTLEKEQWLYRTLHGRKILFSKDLSTKFTTITYGADVSYAIANLIGQKDACGEAFHITGNPIKWQDVLDIYKTTLSKLLGRRITDIQTDISIEQNGYDKYHVCYDRIFNRVFNNTKISRYLEIDKFTKPEEGLEKCLGNFIKEPKFHSIYWYDEARRDKITHERAGRNEFDSTTAFLRYFYYRYKI